MFKLHHCIKQYIAVSRCIRGNTYIDMSTRRIVANLIATPLIVGNNYKQNVVIILTVLYHNRNFALYYKCNQ